MNKFDEGRVEFGEFRLEDFIEFEWLVGEVFFDKNVEGSYGNSVIKRVIVVGRIVFFRFNVKYNIFVGEDIRDGVYYIDRLVDDWWIEDSVDMYYY